MIEKYRFRELEARFFADFLLQMLRWEPKDRPSAHQMLKHPWLKMQPREDWKLSRRELKEFKRVNGFKVSPSRKSSQGKGSIHGDKDQDKEERKEEIDPANEGGDDEKAE